MYVIIVYDVGVERVSKVCYFLRQYLEWVQNSVFEGELTKAELFKIKRELKKLIKEKEDSIMIYKARSKQVFESECIGVEKAEHSTII